MNSFKRFLSLALAVLMTLSYAPTIAYGLDLEQANDALIEYVEPVEDEIIDTETIEEGGLEVENPGDGAVMPMGLSYTVREEADFDELFAEYPNVDEVYLGKDLTLTKTLEIPAEKVLVFHLEGNTLTGAILAPNANLTIEGGTIINNNGGVSAIEINAGKLTLTDVNIESARHAVRIDGAVTATINGGEYKLIPASGRTHHAVNISGAANVTIEDGTFVGPKGTASDSGSAVCVQAGSTATINGGDFSGGKNSTLGISGNLTINGGNFDQMPKLEWVAKNAEFYFEGEQHIENNGRLLKVADIVASIGEVKYTSLQEAIEAVKDNETITLLQSVTVTEAAHGQNALNHARAVSFTLDLGGYTLSADTGNSVFRFNLTDSGATSDVTVTVKNGEVVSGANTWCALMAAGIDGAKAVLNLENLTVESSKAGDLAIKAWGNGVINATDVNVNATNGAGGFYALGGEIVLNEGVTVTQTGLHTAPYLSMAFAVSNGGNITINDGTYSAEPTAAAEGNNQGTSHGSWVGGVMNSGGTLTIKGGTFSNGNFGENSLATSARGLIFADTGAVLNIEGGTFNALKGIIDIQNNLGDASKNPTGTISGGTFSADPTNDYVKLDKDFKVVENEDGTFGIAAKEYVAQIGEEKYESLKDAIDAAENGDEIVLLTGIADLDATISKNITLDLGSNTLTDAYIIVKGNVTIKNGSIKNTAESYPLVVDGGELTIEDVDIEASKSDRAIWVRDNSSLIFNSGSILATKGEGNNNTSLITAIYTNKNTNVTINGGTITVDTPDNKAVGIYGNYENANVTLTDGKISTSGKGYNYGINVNGDITVEGGEIVTNEKGYSYSSGVRYGNNYALVSATGDVTITGGTITTNGYSGYIVNVGRTYSSNDQTVSITGGTFVNNLSEVEQTTGGHKAPVLIWEGTASKVTATISGGDFSGFNANLLRGDNTDLDISGGTFDVAVNEEYLADNYILEQKADGSYGVVVDPAYGAVAIIGETYYYTLTEAFAEAKAGDEVVLLDTVTENATAPAGITIVGNENVEIEGTLTAGGDLTIEGHLKVTSFNASYYNRTITIGEGACLEVTGTGRVTLGYGNTFNITGTITDAKTAGKDSVQPSLIIPGGISITGGNDAAMNVTNAYISIGNTSSKNNAANGKFTLNFTNSIAEFTNQFTLSTPSSGYDPEFIVNVKDSVFTTATKLCIAASNSTVTFDNSNVTLGSYLRNSGNLTIENKSTFTGSMIQFGENGGNDGTITVDNANFTINNNSIHYAMDGKGTGKLVVTNNGEAKVDYIKDTTIELSNGGKLTSKSADLDIKLDEGYEVIKETTVDEYTVYEVLHEVVAKVGNTEYRNIDEAIANWTNNTTLTLLANVTLSDVIQLSSTEKHVLDLGTYTMTAASGKDAIQIVNNGRSSASYALDINADAENPGGITATGKAIVRTTGKSGVKDRPIITFNNGVFNASYIVYHTGSSGTSCPQFKFYGGEFNGTIYTNRTLNQFYGGTFNGSLMMSVDSSAYTLVAGGTFKQLSNLYMSSLNSDKFTIGSAKGTFDREVYINDDGYYVVAKAEPAEGIEADVAMTPGTNDYLKYSKVGNEGQLGYTDVVMALENNKSADVTIYVDELDLGNSSFKGTLLIEDELTVTFAEGTTPAWTVEAAEGDKEISYTETVENGVVTRTYKAFTAVAQIGDVKYESFEEALAAACADKTIEEIIILCNSEQKNLLSNITYDINEGQKLTIKAPEGKEYSVTLPAVNASGLKIYLRGGAELIIAENVTIEGLGIVANGFSTSSDNLTIAGNIKAVSLKQWTSNGTITVPETGSVWLGYGDGQFDLAYGNGTVTVNGNGKDAEEPQFKAGYSGTRGNGNTLNLNNTYFEAGRDFTFNGSNGTINANNSLFKVSGGDFVGKVAVNSTGNVINLTNGSVLEVANITLGAGNEIKLDATSTIKATTITGAGKIVIDATGMTAGAAPITGNASGFTGEIEVINNPELYAKIDENGNIVLVGNVAKIGNTYYKSLEDALSAAQNGETVELIWAKGDAPIAMNGAVYGKSVTITGTANVDWSKGWLYIGRGGEGNGTVIFDNANLTSASNSASYGIHVSGREKDTNNKYDGTLTIRDSNIELDYLINRGAISLTTSTLTVKNGFGIAGRPASETELGEDATATLTLTNDSKVVVNNHNGMGLGQAAETLEGYGVINVGSDSTFETTQNFNITKNGTLKVDDGTVKVVGTLTNNGTVYVTDISAIEANVTGNGWFYMDGVDLDSRTKLSGAKVGFINGENYIGDSTITDGWFSVGIGQNAAAEAAAAFAKANGITLGDVTVNVSPDAVIGSTGSAYNGWVGSAYSADKTQHKYVLNISGSLATFGYMHVSKDGELNVTGHADNKYTYDNANVDFYAGELIINGKVTLNGTDAWVKFTKMSVDHADGVLNITNGTKFESSIHNGSTTGDTLKFWKAGVINIDDTSEVEIDNKTTLVEGAVINIGGKVTAKGAVTGNGSIVLTDVNAIYTAPAGLTVESGLEDYKVTYADGAYKLIAKDYVAQIGDVKYESLSEAAKNIATDGSDTTIKLLKNIEVDDSIEFNYGTGDVIFTADEPVTVKQTVAAKDFVFTKSNDMNLVIEENVTFEIYDNAAGMYIYYGPSLTLEGTVTGGQNWGVLYLFNGNHTVTETGKIGTGRVHLGFTEITVKGEIDTNYLLVEGSSFTADGATVDANVIYDNNNGGQRYGASEFEIKNGSTVTTSKLTLSYADSVLTIDATSSLTAGTIVGAGKIVIDAEGMSAGAAPITGNASGFTGEIEVINNPALHAEIDENGNIVLVGNVATVTDTEGKVTGYGRLQDAFNAAQDGDTITLLEGTISQGTVKMPATLKNVTIKGAENHASILKDMTITASDGNSIVYEGLTFDGIVFDNSRVSITGWRNGEVSVKDLTVTNCVFENLDDTTSSAPFHINMDADEAVENFTFTNNVIDGATGGSKSGVYAQVTGKTIFTNNVINNVAFRPYVIQITTDDGIADEFIVTGNTFSGSAAGRAQGLGNNAEGTDTVRLVINENIFKGITSAQQICYWNFNPETTTADFSHNYYDIDIQAHPDRIYYNTPAASVQDLLDMGIFPYYADEAKTILVEPNYKVEANGEKYLSLAKALEACVAGENLITLLADCAEDVTVVQAPNVKITIDGAEHTMTGTITVNGKSERYETAGLTIKNIDFDATNITKDASINLGGNNNIRYTSNVTVENCDFNGVGNAKAAIKSYTGGDMNLTVTECTATGMHSLAQLPNVIGATFSGCTVDGKNGIALGNSSNVTIENCTITATGYGVRGDGDSAVAGDGSATVKNCNITAEWPVVIRKVTENYNLTVTGSNLIATNENGYQVTFTEGDDGTAVPPTGNFECAVDEGVKVYPYCEYVAEVNGKGYFTLEEALTALKSGGTLELLKNVTITEKWDCRNYANSAPVTINGNEHTIKFTNVVNDGFNHYAAFRFEADATVTGLTIDMTEAISEFNGRFRAISAKADLTVDNCTFIGNGSANNTRAIIFGESSGAAIAEVDVTITNSTFTGWRRAISDNENGQDANSVTITGNTFNDASVVVSAAKSITFNGNKVDDGDVNLYTNANYNDVVITATGNILAEGGEYKANAKNLVVQDEFLTPVAEVNGEKGYFTIADAIKAAKAGDTVTIFAGEYTETINVNKDITVVGEQGTDGENLVSITGKLNVTADGATVKGINFNNGSENAGYISAKDVLIEDCSVVGGNGFRGCYTKGKVTFKDSTIVGGTYGIHFDGSANGEIVIEGCEITGWTSFASTITHVTIKDTEFKDGNYNLLRFYQDATLDNVTIPSGNYDGYDTDGMRIDSGSSGKGMDITITATNCQTADGSDFAGAFPANTAGKGDVFINGSQLLTYALVDTDEYYYTFEEAVADAPAGATVTLLRDATGAGVVIDKDLTVDFGGFTYTVNKAVGSAGTETLGFQIREGNNVTLKNGTLTATTVTEGKAIKMLVQNYADLTLTDMNLNGDYTGSEITYVLSNNSGTSNINGATSITAPANAVAFDVYDYSAAGYDDIPTVNVNTTGIITGNIEVSETATLAISGGYFTAEIEDVWCAEGYVPCKAEKDNTEYWSVVEGKYVAQNMTTLELYTNPAFALMDEGLKAGDTVKLLADCSANYVSVIPGVTLDLNGKVLTANYVVGFNGSNVVDNSEANTGLLKTAAENVVLAETNTQLPVYTGEGYMFAEILKYNQMITDPSKTEGYVQYVFQPFIEQSAHEYILKGSTASLTRIVVLVNWIDEFGTSVSQKFVFNDINVNNLINSYDSASDKYGRALFVNLTGTDNIGAYTIQGGVESNAKVVNLSTPVNPNE